MLWIISIPKTGARGPSSLSAKTFKMWSHLYKPKESGSQPVEQRMSSLPSPVGIDFLNYLCYSTETTQKKTPFWSLGLKDKRISVR